MYPAHRVRSGSGAAGGPAVDTDRCTQWCRRRCGLASLRPPRAPSATRSVRDTPSNRRRVLADRLNSTQWVKTPVGVLVLLGGLIVSAFSLVGDVLKPKSFAGIFGAAPSMALVTLGLAFVRLGGTQVAVQGRSMVAGAVALGCYSWLISRLLLRYRWNPLVATVLSWLLWLAVAFGLWATFLR